MRHYTNVNPIFNMLKSNTTAYDMTRAKATIYEIKKPQFLLKRRFPFIFFLTVKKLSATGERNCFRNRRVMDESNALHVGAPLSIYVT